jgi:hypothetical protein
MTSIDNTLLVNSILCGNCGCQGFIASISYAVNASAKTVTVTDASTIPSGDTLSKINVRVYDNKTGAFVSGAITAGGGNAVISFPGSDFTDISVTATAVTANGCVADLDASHIVSAATSGNLSNAETEDDVANAVPGGVI